MQLTALAAVQRSIPIKTLNKNESKELQTALSLLGYPVGDIDGLIGKNTKGAWAQFAHTISQIDPEGIDPTAIAALQRKLDELAAQDVRPSEKLDKIIVSNLEALTKKYGAAGLKQIQQAIQTLVEADKQRGITTWFFPVDNPATMVHFSTAAVTKADDPKQNKAAVDAIYQKSAPDYIMILGSIDVIPHQDMANPAYAGPGKDDDDPIAFGDLPYACEAAYSRDINKFMGPTRVVGRLPDVTGGQDVHYLLHLLETAANYKSRPVDVYHPYFGIAAKTFETSTLKSLSRIFANNKALKTVPPHDQVWPPESLSRLSHFINCHGNLNDSLFYGESMYDMPPSLDAKDLVNRISEGTIVSAECCFGGQLFDPSQNEEQGRMGIANTYLGNKAYGFLGSTTLAYGTEDSYDSADLICQYFLQKVFQGASLGRATLEARQSFINKVDMDDPTNRKTIAQFNLYGDPSVHPVTPPAGAMPVPAALALTGEEMPAGAKIVLGKKDLSQTIERTQRRRDLLTRGLALLQSQPSIREIVIDLKGLLHAALEKVAADQGLIPAKILSFEVKAPKVWETLPMALFSEELFCDHIHMIFGAAEQIMAAAPTVPEGKTKRLPKVVTALIARERNGQIISVKRAVSR